MKNLLSRKQNVHLSVFVLLSLLMLLVTMQGATAECTDHEAYCTEPDICFLCGKSASKDGITIDCICHYTAGLCEHDAEYCWAICLKCGEETFRYKHKALCSNPEKCGYCECTVGKDGITIVNILHNVPEKYEHDAEYCWRICMDCGEAVYKCKHFSSCSDPEKCGLCECTVGKDSVSISRVYHDIPPDTQLSITPDYHIGWCPVCKKNVEEPHCWTDEFGGYSSFFEAPSSYCLTCGYVKEESVPHSGDSNGDGVTDGRDSLRLLKYLAGQGVSIDEQASDLNGDGVVDGRDSIRLLKLLAN